MSQKVQQMFAGIAPRYDRLNTILSLGLHHYWRWLAVRWSGVSETSTVLDCATGTGDLAFALKKKAPHGVVVGRDFCLEMVEVARTKSTKYNIDVRFEQGDMMCLPDANCSYDLATVAFGIRNVDDPSTALKEMARVVRSEGKVIVLEFGQPEGVLFGPLYRWYSRWIIPLLGRMVSKDRDAYEYLPETAARFPCGTAFERIMQETNCFDSVSIRPLNAGVLWYYEGIVKT